METKTFIECVLSARVGKMIAKKDLEKELQKNLNTRNRFENGDDVEEDNPCHGLYFTNGEADATRNFCDIRIDYLKTRQRGTIYVVDYEILNYYN